MDTYTAYHGVLIPRPIDYGLRAKARYEKTHLGVRSSILKRYKLRLKAKIMNHYGARCAMCGFSDIRALSVDHINGGGTKHIRSIGGNFYGWIIKHSFPSDLQILCMNCQWIKRNEKNEVRKRER